MKARMGEEVLGKGTESHHFIERNTGAKCCCKTERLLVSSRKKVVLNVTGGEGHHTSVPGKMLQPGDRNIRA